tara:strand:- start:6581 stop:6694 length:114 start_codon:yes stop_codon:yes gene_type:complete
MEFLDQAYQLDLVMSIIMKAIIVICLLLWIPTRGDNK